MTSGSGWRSSLFQQCSVKEAFGGGSKSCAGSISGRHAGTSGARCIRLQQEGQLKRHRRLSPTAAFQDVAGVLVISAIPFLAVQALADSDLGSRLQEELEASKPQRRKEEQQYAAEAAAARADSRWYGPERPKWLGPLPHDYPAWLPAEVPGNYAFDPAGLSKDAEKFDRYFELELLHARWAMLGMLGAVLPELLQKFAGVNFVEPVWWRVG
eukprot:CAMPEP_0206141960 /NCGR_PEP_ID=MMETSP1473-20131121/14903_1 /ASSEMBLY_ACC=CAM_ASM_001109 /TAXON_ID=1461547 /ORGANISM="Stichococcus sp, Strain RCC1054" /LENGTH=211 /DNA_ID=CAMNT_0053536733 /DNA_START=296 /DNA_END=928 /DNA_ORIENTATION=-